MAVHDADHLATIFCRSVVLRRNLELASLRCVAAGNVGFRALLDDHDPAALRRGALRGMCTNGVDGVLQHHIPLVWPEPGKPPNRTSLLRRRQSLSFLPHLSCVMSVVGVPSILALAAPV